MSSVTFARFMAGAWLVLAAGFILGGYSVQAVVCAATASIIGILSEKVI